MTSQQRSTSRDDAIREAYEAAKRLLDSHRIADILDSVVGLGHIHYSDQCECAPQCEWAQLDLLPASKQEVVRGLLSQWESSSG